MTVGFAAFVAYQAVHLKLYTPLGPGPGFFPLWLAVALGALAVTLFVQATPGARRLRSAEDCLRRILAAVAGLLAFAVLLGTLGFVVTAFLFYLALLPILGRRSPIGSSSSPSWAAWACSSSSRGF